MCHFKECCKCGERKALADFYAHPQATDGRMGLCKECHKADVRRNRSAKRRRYSEYERERSRRPERRSAQVVRQRKARHAHPDRYRARTAVGNAVRDGRLVPEPCARCGAKRVQAHHEDYSKPLEVTWLCFDCHRAQHGQVVVAPDGARAHKVPF